MENMRWKQLKAILFDHDGTLVNSEPVHYQMWTSVLGRYGTSLTEQMYKDWYAGVPTKKNAQDMVHRFHLPNSAQQLAEEKNALTRAYLQENAFPLMPGARSAIEAFHRAGFSMAVVTGAGSDSVIATLTKNQLADYFVTVVSGDQVVHSKPAPDCYLLALERLGLAASDCLAVEDTQHGLQAARAAGLDCVAIPTEMSIHHNFDGAMSKLNNLSELVTYVERQTARNQV